MDFKKQVLKESVQFKIYNGETWVVANDVGRVLGISRTRDAVNNYVNPSNAIKKEVKYLTGNKQKYQATLINVDGVIQLTNNIKKDITEERRAINNLVVATMINENEKMHQAEEKKTINDLKEDELRRLNNYILLKHIKNTQAELEEKDQLISELRSALSKVNSKVFNAENALSEIASISSQDI